MEGRLVDMVNIVGVITARGNSKGIPKKNIQLVAGKPLIAWTIEAARQSSMLSRVIVSTDSEEISKVAISYGADVPFIRPSKYALDDSPHILSMIHAIDWLTKHSKKPDYLMLLQPTSPLRSAQDIDNAINLMMAKQAKAVVSVCEVNQHPQKMYTIKNDVLECFIKSNINYLRRQELPHFYLTNGAIYLNQTISLLSEKNFVPPGTYPYIMPPERSIDIDSTWDMKLAEIILNEIKDEYA